MTYTNIQNTSVSQVYGITRYVELNPVAVWQRSLLYPCISKYVQTLRISEEYSYIKLLTGTSFYFILV